jgi:hypothetical protein
MAEKYDNLGENAQEYFLSSLMQCLLQSSTHAVRPKYCCCCGWLSSHVCAYPIPARVICIYAKYNETKKNIMQIFITYTISTPLNDKYFDYFHLHM